MKYIKVDTNTWIRFNPINNSSEVILKDKTQEELINAQEQLQNIPEFPADEELLAWAKLNYPMMDYSVQKQYLTDLIAKNTELLENLK